jgi:hypothetical protein
MEREIEVPNQSVMRYGWASHIWHKRLSFYINLRFLNSDRKRLQRTIHSITVEWHC